MISEFIQFSLTPILIGILAGISCAVPGNFLILKRQALIGDAISHVVLPGIVIAFIFTGVVSTIPMLLGAAAAAIVAVLLIEVIKRFGKIEPGAAMGVVFTGMFAFGVLVLEQTDTSKVHLDVEHALMGNLESLIWLQAEGWQSLFDLDALRVLPDELFRITFVCGFILFLTIVFWRWLKIVTFDEAYAKTIGIRSSLISFSLVIITAVAAVAVSGLNYRNCNVHMPTCCSKAHDKQSWDSGHLVNSFCNIIGNFWLYNRRIWAAVVWP